MDTPEYTEVQRHEGARAGIAVSVRLKPDEAQLLRALSERDGRTLSDTLRVALHVFAQQPPLSTSDTNAQLTRGGVFVDEPRDLMLV